MKPTRLLIIAVTFLIAIGCANKEKTENKENEKNEEIKSSVLNAHKELFDNENYGFADVLFHKDYANGKGPDYIKERLQHLKKVFPDLEVNVDKIVVEGNTAAWRRKMSGTHSDTLMGFPPTFKKVEWSVIVFTEYNNDGMIMEEWSVNDLFAKLSYSQ